MGNNGGTFTGIVVVFCYPRVIILYPCFDLDIVADIAGDMAGEYRRV